MTTIAFDGRYLAADQGFWNDGVVEKGEKIFNLGVCPKFPKGAILAMCGYTGTFRPMVEYLLSHDDRGFDCSKFDLTPNTYIGLLFDESSVHKLYGDGHLDRVSDKFYTLGSGHAFAFGALLAGASAQQAIELAIEYTDFAKRGVTLIDLQETFPDAKLYRLQRT